MQKVYSEAVLNLRHDVWDIHTNKDRWWVITGGTNLYSQEQFPNMDLALTFHIGLIFRIPHSEKQQGSPVRFAPFGNVFAILEDAGEAVKHAHSLSDYQTVGVRCRETLLAFVSVSQDLAVWTTKYPQRENFKEWVEIIINDLLPGDSHRARRGALKGALDGALTFANWLTHSKSATWYDAEMAFGLVEHALGIATPFLVRKLREVPEECPACGSPRLEPEQGHHTEFPDVVWERPQCLDCGWTGRPIPIMDAVTGEPIVKDEGGLADECGVMQVPLRAIVKPGEPAIQPLSTSNEIPGISVYFAYGSNMSSVRLKSRMPSSKVVGLATLPGHSLRFHKRSKDGSGKCNAVADPEGAGVIGVLYTFDPKERTALDKAEGAGAGYEAQVITVRNEQGRRQKVLTYLADPGFIDDQLSPYDWYKEFVIAGANEHGLPSDYVADWIQRVESREDPDVSRAARERKTLASSDG